MNLPDFISTDMDYAGRTDLPQVTEPAGNLPGTGATAVAPGAGPLLDITDLSVPVPAPTSPSGIESVGYTALPATSNGPQEKIDVAISNGTASGDRRQPGTV